MQKKLIALAVAGLAAAPAFAQTNVTIYGIADATFDVVRSSNPANSNDTLGSTTRVSSNSSLTTRSCWSWWSWSCARCSPATAIRGTRSRLCAAAR